MSSKIKILINTDLGDDVDDAIALGMAIKSPEIEILGIVTAFRNTSKRVQMVKDVLKLYGREDIPVIAGIGQSIIERVDPQELPLQYELLREDWEVENRVDPIDFIIRTFVEHPDAVFVEMATQTNLALAFLRAPEVMKSVKIIGMGGAFLNSFAEWNVKWDPEAVRIVTDYAQDLTLFGLDVTKYCKLYEENHKWIEDSKSAISKYHQETMTYFTEKTGFPITLHDVILIAYLLDPTIASLVPSDFTVELSGARTRGTIIHNTDYYLIDPSSSLDEQQEKQFFYADKINQEAFNKMVMERVFTEAI